MTYDVGKVFESNNCGKFIITKIIDCDKREIQFLNTGAKKVTYRTSIRSGRVKDDVIHITKYNVGDVFQSNNFGKYKITKVLDNDQREIQFLDTGYKTIVDTTRIKTGEIRDIYFKSVCGIGVLGKYSSSHYLYSRWHAMLCRCYDKNNSCYETYGGSGVQVCPRWHYFENYVKDIESLENSDKLKGKNSSDWHIDKDIKIENNKIYSKNTVLIVKSSQNVAERNSRYNKKPINMLDLNGNFIKNFNSIKEATEFAAPHLEYSTSIIKCAKGEMKTAYGYKWTYADDNNFTL